MDINAKSASEVAISILADIIEDFRAETPKTTSCCSSKTTETTKDKAALAFEEEYYINPVCNVPVSKKNPKHIVDYEGENVYFCCDGCKVSFEKNPVQYMSPSNG